MKGLLLDCVSHAASSWRHQSIDEMTQTQVCTGIKKNVLNNETRLECKFTAFEFGKLRKGFTAATSLRKWRKAERSFLVTKAVSRI